MIPFEKTAGRWKGGGFSRQPDYGFADFQRSVMAFPPPVHAANGEVARPAFAP